MATTRRARITEYVGPKSSKTPEDLPALEASGEFVFEQKHDGFWACVVVKKGVVSDIVSRTGLSFTAAETQGLLGLQFRCAVSGRLVGELTADLIGKERIGTRRLHLFDVLDWNGMNFRDLPQTERREALETVASYCFAGMELVRLVEQRTTGIRAWYDEIIRSGGEGLVGKKKDARLRAATADGKIEDWFRVKPRRCVEMVVLGFGVAEKGTPNVDLGLYKDTKEGRRVVKVQTCTRPSDLDLKEGLVVEVQGAEIFPSGAVRHGHIEKIRTDKLPESCTYEAAMEQA